MRLIDADALEERFLTEICGKVCEGEVEKFIPCCDEAKLINSAPTVASAVEWHKVTTRPLTEEEQDYYKEQGMEEISYIFDCEMPDDGEEILIATKWGVDKDVCCNDGYYGIWLDGNDDWDDVLAWAKMPEYKECEE